MTDEEKERDAELGLDQWRREMKLRRKQDAIDELVDQAWAGMKVIDRLEKRIKALEAKVAPTYAER